MPLVSLKTKNEDDYCGCTPESSPYGWGTSIRLNEDQCEALGITSPPAAGTRITITAAAYVAESTSCVEADGDDKGPDVMLTLQLTDMEISGARTSQDTTSLYPNSSLL